jgi:ABC-type glycerol-3-phosphate transport system substrate-binding protein
MPWPFLEFMLSKEGQLAWCDPEGLVPAVRTVAQSSEFIKSTPVRMLAVDELAYAKWAPTMPGAGAFLDTVLEFVGQAAQGRMAPRDALEEAAAKVQPILDRNK